ncbi:HD domain-containing protein [Gorillibacterium massiliense]|uniref:HD domain-containing protein n=1 Tax=Gorillibacterium massiliense TaxID=1280390 RepID=UPI0004AE7A10|nr:HD domain-containing protein [Gorillibacterium massiliense]
MNRLNEEKVFKDPVHKYIYVQDRTIWDLINTREFQRLRRIRQLGTSYLTFHGAEHSRFSHSLGVYEVTRRIISQFERSQYSAWNPEETLLCLCAALLHDIGHGPFSHSVEQTFGVHHEDWSCRIILGDTEVNRVLTAADPELPRKIAGVICKTYENPVVTGLISSQLDADRMDYLLRDAYFTGVNYGTFDLDRILRVLRPYPGGIAVKDSGMHAVEDYLMSRYQMYWQIYFHPVTRSAEILLSKTLQRAKDLFEDGYPFSFMVEPLRRLLTGKLDVPDYLELDEALLQAAFQQWMREEDRILADLCSRFLNRKLFRYVPLAEPAESEDGGASQKTSSPTRDTGDGFEAFDDMNHDQDEDRFEEEDRDKVKNAGKLEGEFASDLSLETFDQIRESLREAGMEPDYYLAMDFPSDLPYDVYRPGQRGDKRPILLLDRDNGLVEISRKSEIVRSISGVHAGQHQLYFPGEILESPSLPREIRRFLARGKE